MTLAGIGLAAGAVGAWLLTRLMEKLLFGVTPSDPLTFAAVAAPAGTGRRGGGLRARLRATRVDPVVALRAE